MPYNRLSEEDQTFLKTFLDEDQISTGESYLALHSADQAYHKGYLPEVIIWPKTTEQVSGILKMADARRIPVTPWGAGTSLEGNCVPAEGGIVVDFQYMNKILKIREMDFQVDVQAGVTYKDMNRALAGHGLFFPPDPGANATIGGMVANNASGIRTIKYGSTKDNVLRLTAVLAGGEIIHAGSHSLKSSSGYDLVRLFTGSEGTLAVITEITLKLSGIPEHFSAGVVSFESVKSATDSVYEIMGYGLIPAALEVLDAESVGYINKGSDLELTEKPTLFIEFTGSDPAGLKAELKLAEEICIHNGGMDFQSGVGREARNRLWEARHRFGESLIRCNPGLDVLIMDTAVPLSNFSDMVAYATETADSFGLRNCVSAHAGDGNLHLNIIGDMEDPQFLERLNIAYEKIVSYAISVGGTATGEHGVGMGKRKFMFKEHGQGIEVMRGIKKFLDPNGILNPGKIFPD
jgi:D-lactate dehydrogenase (cytochrome)